MSTLAKLNADNLAKTIEAFIVNDRGLWRTLAIASDEMRAWDNGCGRHLVYSDVLDVTSYVAITVTGRKMRNVDGNSLLTVQVNNGEETYKAEIAFRGYGVTMEEAKNILEV